MILIILNKLSGSGKSLQIFQNYVKPYLLNNNYDYTLVNDNNFNNVNFHQIKKIIIMGGDGTLSYCINNNICNDKLIYIIPTGSGNGLAKNLNICNIKDSINALNCDNKVKIKLQNIKYNNKSKKSFLYITLGLISAAPHRTFFFACFFACLAAERSAFSILASSETCANVFTGTLNITAKLLN